VLQPAPARTRSRMHLVSFANKATCALQILHDCSCRGFFWRLKDASGTLTLKAKLIPVLFNAAGAAQFLTSTGKFEGTVFGADIEEGRDERQ
jgi:hypothetical protein